MNVNVFTGQIWPMLAINCAGLITEFFSQPLSIGEVALTIWNIIIGMVMIALLVKLFITIFMLCATFLFDFFDINEESKETHTKIADIIVMGFSAIVALLVSVLVGIGGFCCLLSDDANYSITLYVVVAIIVIIAAIDIRR